MKIWAMPCRDPQGRWIIVKSSDKTWSTGRGSGKPLQYSWGEKAMNSMKRQKDDASRWASPGWKVSSMLLGRSGGPLLIAPERMKPWDKVEMMSISSLIQKMLIFTLVIFCLTILPWFMDISFQIPMQCCFYNSGLYFHPQIHSVVDISGGESKVQCFNKTILLRDLEC